MTFSVKFFWKKKIENVYAFHLFCIEIERRERNFVLVYMTTNTLETHRKHNQNFIRVSFTKQLPREILIADLNLWMVE